MSTREEKTVATNRRARHDYAIEDTLEAGMVLCGSEVKSLRLGKITLKDGYVLIHEGEVFLENVHIQEYAYANRFNHRPARRRKLLLNRREIDRLDVRISQKGYSVVPLRVYFVAGRAKVELGVGKGKREHDKRQDLKAKDARREMDRAMKH